VTGKTYDRTTVLALAMNVFWLRGYQGASVQELCRATGLNRKTLYAEFGDKASLFAEALAMYTQGAMVQTRAVLSAEPLGRGNIRRYFRGMNYEPECRGCLMTMTINERALVPPPSVPLVADTIGQIEALFLANLLADGLDESTSRRLAAFLVFSIQGITTMGKLEGDNTRLAQVIDTVLGSLG